MHLDAPYKEALDAATTHIHERWSPDAVIASGSIVRGDPDPNSDLDIVVVHDQPWRQRDQHRFNGVPTEIFVNPMYQLERTIDAESRSQRPVMANMLATGQIVHDTHGIAALLQVRAREMLADGPQLPDETMTILRYGAACEYEDAVDVAAIDPGRSRMLLFNTLDRVAVLAFLLAGHWPPRYKKLLVRLPEVDARAEAEIRSSMAEPDISEALVLAQPVVERVVGTTRFFSWTGEPQPLEP